jgi:hypothetical protein
MIRKYLPGRMMGAFALVLVSLYATLAHAAGTFRLKNSEVQEVSGGWHIFVDVGLPRAPSIPHLPMKFLFTKLAVYERALVDNHAEPVMNRQPLVNQTPTIEDQDVDFADPSGKVFNRTRFDFSLTRTRGYEAGEYKVQLRTADGVDVGGPLNLTLKGDNPVVDRRAMNFNAKENSIKKVDNGVDGGQVAKNDDDNSVGASKDVTASGTAEPFIPSSAFQKTPEEEIKTRPSGCGCSVPGHDGGHPQTPGLDGTGPLGGALLASLPGLALLVLAGRRKRRA